MPYFLCKLLPPRANFIGTISADEQVLMRAHFNHWGPLVANGRVLIMGPVHDPKGDYGVAVLEAKDADEALALWSLDPVIKADKGFSFDIAPMSGLATRGLAP